MAGAPGAWMAYGDRTDAYPILRQLLQLVFPGFRPYHIVRHRVNRDTGSLDPRQRAVLEGLVASDAAWTQECGLDRHLEDLGLPVSREALRAFLKS